MNEINTNVLLIKAYYKEPSAIFEYIDNIEEQTEGGNNE